MGNLYKTKNNSKNDFLNTITDSSCIYSYYNSFIVFKSLDDNFILVYSNNFKNIIFYNLIDNRRINKIINAHRFEITNFYHCFDKNNNRNLILSVSGKDLNVKVWNLQNLDNIVSYVILYTDIKNVNIMPSILINNDNNIYIITSHSNGPIKVFDLDGNKTGELESINTYFIDNYYDIKYSINYIITGNKGNVISYNFNRNKKFRTYSDKGDSFEHTNIIINSNEDIIKIIELTFDGIIRIWNFYSAELIDKIKFEYGLYSICLLDKNRLFIGYDNICLIDLNNKEIIQKYIYIDKMVVNMKKIIHPKYGNLLIFQDSKKGGIEFKTIKKNDLI